MEKNDRRISEADHAAIGTNCHDHHSASTLRQSLSVHDTRGHGMVNTRHIPPAKYGRKNGLTDEAYNLVMGRQQFMGTWPVRDSSRNAYSDFGPRTHEHSKVQETKSKDQHQFLRSRDIIYPNDHQSSLNPRQILPARDGWYYRMTDDEYNLVMNRQQLRIINWPMRDSSRNAYSDFGPRAHKHTKLQEMKSRENQHRFLPRRDTRRGGDIINPNAHQSSLNLRQNLPARDEWQYRMTNEEYNLFMSRHQLRIRNWAMRDLSRNAYSDFGPRAHEHSKVQETKSKDQHQFLRRKDTRRGGDIVHPNVHYPSNARQILPERDRWQHRLREEYSLVMARRQLRMRTWLERDSSRNADFKPREPERPKIQERKFREEQHQFLQRTDKRSGDIILDPNDHPLNPRDRQIIPARDGRQHRMTDEGQQLKMRTCSVGDSNRNGESDVRLRMWGNSPKAQEIKFSNDLRHRRKVTEGIKNPNDHPIDGMTMKSVPAQEPNPQEHPALIDRYQMNETTSGRDSNRDVESDIRSKIIEHPTKEQLRESNKFWLSKHQRRLTRIIEDQWSLLYAKVKVVWIELFRIICLILLITVIVCGILLYFYSLNETQGDYALK